MLAGVKKNEFIRIYFCGRKGPAFARLLKPEKFKTGSNIAERQRKKKKNHVHGHLKTGTAIQKGGKRDGRGPLVLNRGNISSQNRRREREGRRREKKRKNTGINPTEKTRNLRAHHAGKEREVRKVGEVWVAKVGTTGARHEAITKAEYGLKGGIKKEGEQCLSKIQAIKKTTGKRGAERKGCASAKGDNSRGVRGKSKQIRKKRGSCLGTDQVGSKIRCGPSRP